MKERRRLDPEARQRQLLDVTAVVVVEAGAADCSIDAVAERAGVTPQLVRKYFGNRVGLLSSLFEREMAAHRRSVADELRRADGFEDVVRAFVRANFRELSSATALGRLRATPEVVESVAPARDDVDRTNRLLLRAVRDEFGLDRSTAIQALTLGSAASIAAGNHFARHGGDEEQQVEATVRFVLAGVGALSTVGPAPT